MAGTKATPSRSQESWFNFGHRLKIVRRSRGGRLLDQMAGDLSARQPPQPNANGAAKGNPNAICNRVSHLAAPVHKGLRELNEYAEGNPVEGVFPKLLRLCKAHGEHE